MRDNSSVDAWLQDAREAADLRVNQIKFSECDVWTLDDGRLRHESGGFFSVVGLSWWESDNPKSVNYSPYIDQHEIGVLGFVIRATEHGIEFLAHAKTEPGNVGGTQISPTVQATRSNYSMVHGGKPTKYFELFSKPEYYVADTAQSEQGTQFLLKFNRNVVVAVPPTNAPLAGDEKFWRWIDAQEFRTLLGRSYLVNTDARSVISTAPWALLSNGNRLFRSDVLQQSFAARASIPPRSAVENRLEFGGVNWELLPIDALSGWQFSDDEISSAKTDKRISYFDVSVYGREVSKWCQPLICVDELAHHTLLAQFRDGILHVFLRFYREAGFGGRAEFGPSLSSTFQTPTALKRHLRRASRMELASIQQSDEGGRFMKVNSEYKISLIRGPQGPETYDFGSWVNLATLERLVRKSGATTNELRTLTSLLLSEQIDNTFCEKVDGMGRKIAFFQKAKRRLKRSIVGKASVPLCATTRLSEEFGLKRRFESGLASGPSEKAA